MKYLTNGRKEMNVQDKIDVLFDKHFSVWINERRNVEDSISGKQPAFCCCGRLATGLHESRCKRFQNKVDAKTISNLNYLLK